MALGGFIEREPRFLEAQARLGTEIVGVDQAKIVYAAAGKRSAIATADLAVCSAVVVQFEDREDSSRRGTFMAHYDPVAISRFSVKNDILFNSKSIQSPRNRFNALVVAPGQMDPCSPTSYSPQDGESERVRKLTSSLKEVFGSETPVGVVGFKPWNKDLNEQLTEVSGSTLRGTLLVEYSYDKASPRTLVDGIEVDLSACPESV